MRSFFYKTGIIAILLFILTWICALTYCNAVSEDISQSFLRLHVIANSNSIEDQNLKYKVRDNIIKYMNTQCTNINTKKEALEIAKKNKDELYNIAKQTIEENGYLYDVKINIGNFNFPTKQYGDIKLPAGFYDAIRIEIGNSQGQNWWCVMFPPLCFVDVSSGIVPDESKDTLKTSLNNEEEYLLLNEEKTTDIKVKFKLLEFFQNIKIETAKK